MLKYGGGENVSMWYVLNFGVKVEVQSKYRVCGPGGCGIGRTLDPLKIQGKRR